MNESKKRVFLQVIIVLLVAMLTSCTSAFTKTKKAMDNLQNVEIDMNMVNDGKYFGDTDIGLVCVEVKVTVENHKIKDIALLKHKNGLGKKAETILDVIIEKNTYDVDSVSGATVSSKTIINAVNKALQKGLSY